MRIIDDKTLDPAYNLALEEYLVTGFTEPIFRIWQNDRAVIVGRNQNTMQEINYPFLKERQIPVIRRMSGGGAVFHDLGNINYTFVQRAGEDDFNNYARFCAPILEALKRLGVKAELSGRNDMLIDGKKFSGNAQYMWHDRMLHHGTLMLYSDIGEVSAALQVNPLKIRSKGIRSVSSRVTNIGDHLRERIPVEEFIARIVETVEELFPDAQKYSLSERDRAAVLKLREEKYATYEWNFGYSPAYSFQRDAYLRGGLFSVRLDVKDGVIQAARIFGDYFGKRDVAEIERALCGVRHEEDAIFAALSAFPLEDYFVGVELPELCELFL